MSGAGAQSEPNGRDAVAVRAGGASSMLFVVGALAVIVAAVVFRYGEVIAHAGTHFVDFERVHGGRLINELPDSRLNSWIVAWVQRAALTDPGSLFDGNIFHPAPGVITGSEHLIGVALQLLPVRLFTDNAVAFHQFALSLSALLLGLCTFVAVRGWTGRSSLFAATVAAVAAVWMPWRSTELSHLQLTSAQFFPLVWWWALRELDRETSMGQRAALAAVTAVQLLSSFYLAYFLTFSLAMLIGTVVLVGEGASRRRGRLLRLAVTLAPAYGVFMLTGIPYLLKRGSGVLDVGTDPLFSLGVSGAWHLVHPRWPHAETAGPGPAPFNDAAVYDVPYGVLLCGLLAVGSAFVDWRRRRAEPAEATDAAPPGTGSAVLGLCGVVALGFVFTIGGSVEVAGVRVPLPTYFLSQFFPGYEMLRGPARWSILIGLAFPLLAGIGIARLEGVRTAAQRFAVRAVVVVLFALTLDVFTLPVKPAWTHPAREARRAEVIANLPDPSAPAALLPMGHGLTDGARGSEAVLQSTRHWRPILNGYTGHAPPSYKFVRTLTEQLPDRRAITHLRRLTGVRWAVLETERLGRNRAADWDRAERRGDVRTHVRQAGLRVVDLAPTAGAAADAGSWKDALVDPAPRATTFAGLSREPLAFGHGDGSQQPVGRIHLAVRGSLLGQVDNPVVLRVRNASSVAWPGFDIQREGLVLLRYTVAPAGASLAERGDATFVTTLNRDIAAGEAAEIAMFLRPKHPERNGPQELCADLVQWIDGEPHALPVEPVRTTVPVLRRKDSSGLQDLIELYRAPREPIAPCGT